jgi:L-ascorbate metabolism protein UlaG (beta-lactamase superfamily)
MITRPFFLLMMTLNPMLAGLTRYADLVVSDSPGAKPNPDSIRISYLGTNGYQFETAGHTLLIDPYFSRISLARVGLGLPLKPDPERIQQGIAHLNSRADGILITHGHFDHLLDAVTIMQRTGAVLAGSSTAIELATRVGAQQDRCVVLRPDATRTFGPWRVRALPAAHDQLPLIGVPFDRPLTNTRPPRRAADWVCGEPLAYLISANGQTIYIDSGGTPALLPPANVSPVDLAILGVALADARQRFAAAVLRLRPRYVLPSHQDNFFIPVSRGFQFGPFTSFPSVRRQFSEQHLPGRLILLDYFKPWTLPRR